MLSRRLRSKLALLPGELAALGYTAKHVGGLMGAPPNAPFLYASAFWPLLLRRPHRGEDLLHALSRFLIAGSPLPWRTLTRAFSIGALDALVEADFVERSGREARPQVVLFPFTALYLASDFPWRWNDPDLVWFPDSSGASLLPFCAARTPVGDVALDLGTGNGLVALHIARRGRYRHVHGVDLNRRALAFAEKNAAMNGLSLELTRADAAQALAGTRHADLVTFAFPHLYTVPRPPGVIAHAAKDGAALLQRTLRVLPRALRPGGEAVFFHQVLRAELPKLFGATRLRVWRFGLENLPGGIQFGVTRLVKEGQPGFQELRLLPSLSTNQVREWLRSMALLEGDTEALSRARPHVPDDLLLLARLPLVDGKLAAAPHLFADNTTPFPQPLLAFLRRCDGRASVGELFPASLSDDDRDILRWLVERGFLFFNE